MQPSMPIFSPSKTIYLHYLNRILPMPLSHKQVNIWGCTNAYKAFSTCFTSRYGTNHNNNKKHHKQCWCPRLKSSCGPYSSDVWCGPDSESVQLARDASVATPVSPSRPTTPARPSPEPSWRRARHPIGRRGGSDDHQRQPDEPSASLPRSPS
jgi:hypothetical protein